MVLHHLDFLPYLYSSLVNVQCLVINCDIIEKFPDFYLISCQRISSSQITKNLLKTKIESNLKEVFMTKTRAQSAFGFLMTYGWAILIVLVVIGALAYFGVLNPARFLPRSCILMPGVSCLDFKVNTAGIALTLLNGQGSRFTSFSITVQGETGDPCDGEILTTVDGLGAVEIETVISECVVEPLENTRFKADLLINYQLPGQLIHTKTGSITTFVESGSITSADLGVCQNADAGGLCPGLDIVFGVGYRDSCCGEYTLCC